MGKRVDKLSAEPVRAKSAASTLIDVSMASSFIGFALLCSYRHIFDSITVNLQHIFSSMQHFKQSI